MKYIEIEKRFSTMVDDKAEDETNNYSSTSTRVGNMSLVKHIEDEYSVYNHERRSSLPW